MPFRYIAEMKDLKVRRLKSIPTAKCRQTIDLFAAKHGDSIRESGGPGAVSVELLGHDHREAPADV
jgi:hypothetical protein